MRPPRIGLIALLTLLATLASNNVQLIQNPNSKIPSSLALAQTPDALKAEAERLLNSCTQSVKTNQYQAASYSCYQAAMLNLELHNRQSEAKALNYLGVAYRFLADLTKAIDYLQQSLAIARAINDRQLEGMVLSNLSDAYISQSDAVKGIDYAQQSLAVARAISDRQTEAKALNHLGEAYRFPLGEAVKAIDYLQQSIAIARAIDNRQIEAVALTNLGHAYRDVGDLVKANDYMQQGLAIARSIPERRVEAFALGSLGFVYHQLGDSKKAIEYQQQSLSLAKELKYRKREADALLNLGMAYFDAGDFDKAVEYYQQSLAIAREIKHRAAEGDVLLNIGNAYYSLGDYKKAIHYFQQGLAIAREIKYRASEGEALRNLGNVYLYLADGTKAIEYYQQFLSIAKSSKNRISEGNALSYLGTAYSYLGDYTKAINYYQQSSAIAKSITARPQEALALQGLGTVYFYLGDYATAIDYCQQSLAIAREVKARPREEVALSRLGDVYFYLGDYTKAIDYYQQSLAIVREVKGRSREAGRLANLGMVYSSLGDYRKAIEYEQQSLAILREINYRGGEPLPLDILGDAYLALGDYNKATEYYQQALAVAQEVKDDRAQEASFWNLGVVYYYLGDYNKAIGYHQQSLAIAQKIKDIDGVGSALTELGAAWQKQGNLPQAEKLLTEGVEVWESIRGKLGNNDIYKVSIFERQALTYRRLQQVLIAQNQPMAALEIAERGRARAFVELLARHNATTSDSINSPITPPTIKQLQQIAKEQNATVVEYSITYDGFKIKGKQETHEDQLYVWVIKPTGEVTFRRSDLKPLWQQQNTSLENLVTVAREAIGVRARGLVAVANGDEAGQTQRFEQLHQLLIEPIADLLPADPNARVVFIPQSSLFLVPFPALLGKDGKYLIEKHTILTAPSIQVLELTRKQRQRIGAQRLAPLQRNDALVVGNPTMPSLPPTPGEKPQQLPSLPGTQQEANAIAPLLNTKPLIGNEATKSAVVGRLSSSRIIHLATHGLLDEFRGLGSAIALAPDSSYKEEVGKVNGLLTAEEILELKLNAELVVLSACNTGRGRITGDGVIGLSRSLISAGVPSVLVSLWSVPDAPTASLMTEFYQNLQKNPDKAQALRQAMLTTMKQHPNPKNWAAFTLIGEAN